MIALTVLASISGFFLYATAAFCILDKAAKQRKTKARRNAKLRKDMVESTPRTSWCPGCDEIVPKSWMAFVDGDAYADADSDGLPDPPYLCRVCRGTTATPSQEETSQRLMDSVYAPKVLPTRHYREPECQCSLCNPEPRLDAVDWPGIGGTPAEDYMLVAENINDAIIDIGKELAKANKQAKKQARMMESRKDMLRMKYGI